MSVGEARTMEEGWERRQRAAAAGGCVDVYMRLRRRMNQSSGAGGACRQRAALTGRRRCSDDVTRPAARSAVAGSALDRRHPACGRPGRGHRDLAPQDDTTTRSPVTARRRGLRLGSAIRLTTLLLIISLLRIAECCSSRANPRPRSPSPSTRRPYTFQTQPCPAMYQEHYCLNGATCFKVNIGHSPLYNCECADGFMGQRCEFKDLDGSYSRSRDAILETASIAGGAGVALLVCALLSGILYVWSKRRRKLQSTARPDGYRFNLDLPPASHVVQMPANQEPGADDVIELQRADRWTPQPTTNELPSAATAPPKPACVEPAAMVLPSTELTTPSEPTNSENVAPLSRPHKAVQSPQRPP